MIKVSAPGKLMLFGEHAVVYGYPCIVTAISERLEVSISKIDDISMDRRFVDAAVRAWGDGKNYAFSIKSAFSGTYGFGSSAAVTVATLKAMRPNAENRALFDAAYKVVLDVQGIGSGFDVASSIYGGTLYFLSGGKTIDPLEIQNLPLIVAYSGVKSSTVEMVKMVREKRNKYPDKVDRIFQAIGTLVNQAKKKMLEGDWERVGKYMDFNQEYLRDLGVSSEKLETLIGAAKNAGAWGAKLSGAGGGDCMIAFVPPERQGVVKDAIMSAGGQVVAVHANAEGVRIES